MNRIADTAKAGEVLTRPLWLIFGMCFLANIMGGTVSTLMSVYLPTVVNTLLGQIDGEKFNFVSAYINALYVLGWATGGLTWGIIGDRIGRSMALRIAVTSYGIFTMLTGLVSSWELVVLLRFLTGFGVGGVLVLSTTLLSEVLPKRFRSILIGILSIGFPVGVFSAGLVNYLVQDWRQGFLIGFLPLCIGIISIWLVKESEEWKLSKLDPQRSSGKQERKQYKGQLIKGAIVFGSMLIGLWGLFSWLPTWVQSLLEGGSGQEERGLSMMLLGGGGLLGGFFSGWVSNSLGVRRAMMLCFLGCIVMSVLLFGVNQEFSKIIYLETALLAVFFGISQGLLSIYIPGLFPTGIRASSTGFCFNIGRLVTAAAVFFVGVLVTFFGGYGNTLLAFSGIFVLGFIVIYLGKEDEKPVVAVTNEVVAEVISKN